MLGTQDFVVALVLGASFLGAKRLPEIARSLRKSRCRSPLRRRHAAMSVILCAGILSVLISGCASLANTPEQDLALSRWTACRTQGFSAELRRVQTDGRIFFWYSGPSEAQAMLACLRQAGKDGPALPDPTPEPRAGGGGGM